MQVLFADLYSPYIPIPEGRGFTALFGKAKIVLSGYSCDLYDSKLAGWHKDTAASQITSGEFVEEVVWTNFKQYNQMSLFEKI